jgi:uncharacterized protein (TIGR00369 family)
LGTSNCFVCGTDNPHGLHVAFENVGEGEVAATYRCTESMIGWPGIQHGGITAALLDEASAYVPYYLGLTAVTARLDIRYHKPIQTGEQLSVTGKLTRRTSRLMEVEARITGEDGELKAQSNATMMILNRKQQESMGLANSNL